MLQTSDVEHIAKLAKLELTPQQIEQMRSQLADVLAYIDTLSQIDTTDVEPTSLIDAGATGLRPDEVGASFDPHTALANAPRKRMGHFSVPKVISQG